MIECPQCGSDALKWITSDQDQFGKIRILSCSECLWDEENELLDE